MSKELQEQLLEDIRTKIACSAELLIKSGMWGTAVEIELTQAVKKAVYKGH